MKNAKLEKKLRTLKEIIKSMNSNTEELISFSAQLENRLKRINSNDSELNSLEFEIDRLIEYYRNYLK
jgi:DNA repair ATPase RecN